MKNEYVGIYDHKESDTFRPTLKSRIHRNSPVSKTLTCREDSCCVIERERENLCIRKLTPLECLLLMGFTKQDYDSLRQVGQSDSQIYHEAGDSIVTTVIAYIMSSLFDTDGKLYNNIEKYIVEDVVNGRNNQ